MTVFTYLIGVAVGAIAVLVGWIIWLDHKDEIWRESEMVKVEVEEPDFFAWEVEMIGNAGDDANS
jgi:hypothetical protein